MAQLVKNRLQWGRPGFHPWVGKIPWRRERLPTPVFWPGEFHGPYSPWGCKESDTTERLSLSLCFHFQMASNIDCARTCLWIFLKSVTPLLLPPVQKYQFLMQKKKKRSFMERDVVASQEIVSLNILSEHQRIAQQRIYRTLKYFNLRKYL